MPCLTVSPAYGRDYKSKAEVLSDLLAGKDFIIEDVVSPDCGRYINLPQVPAGTTLNVRYSRMTKVAVFPCPIKVKEAGEKKPRGRQPAFYYLTINGLGKNLRRYGTKADALRAWQTYTRCQKSPEATNLHGAEIALWDSFDRRIK